MRATIALALLCAPAVAHADSYVELAAGLDIPQSDETYTDAVDTSPLFAVRVGAYPKSIGGYLSFEWMPADANADGTFGLDVTAHRFRAIIGPELYHPVSNTLSITARAGVGLDIAHDHVEGTILGTTIDDSETDLGLGFEFGAGIWFHLGGIEVGGQLAVPVSIHDDDPNENDFDYDYTSVDIQLIAGVRFVTRSGGGDD